MRFNVAQLLKEPTGSSRHFSIEEAHPALGTLDVNTVSGSAHLLRLRESVLVTAALDLSVHVTCARCLDDATIELHVSFEEEFLPTLDIATGARLSVPQGDEAFRIDEHHILDLTEAVRQYGLLALPLTPLCRPDCAGICPQCGRNRNYEVCFCEPLPDERWAVLLALREQMKNGRER